MERPKVGVGVIICKDGKILWGRRKNAHGDGQWSFPGGHLEYGEDVFSCAKREVKEETGLNISDLRLGPYTNDIFSQEQKHYVTLYVLATTTEEPQLLEPHKCEGWVWKKDIPEPLFLPVKNLLKMHDLEELKCKSL